MAKKQNITGMSVSWVDLRIIILYLKPHPQLPLQGKRGVICLDVYKDKASPPAPLREERGVICLDVYEDKASPPTPLRGERGVICLDVYKDKASPPAPLREERGVICLVVYLLRLSGWAGAVRLVGQVRQVRQIKPYFISNADTLALFPPEFSSSKVL